MKVIILALFASLAVGGVFGGERENAIREVQEKYKEMFDYSHTVTKHIQDEIKKRDDKYRDETIQHGEKTKTRTLQEFADEVKKVSRTAVVKGKPLSTFECIAKTSLEGRQQILDTKEEFVDKINSVVEARASRLGFSLISAGVILNAVTELKVQAVKNIETAESGIKSLREEALKRIETGRKLMENLQKSTEKPSLFEEYQAIKQSFDSKFTSIKDALFRRLQKC